MPIKKELISLQNGSKEVEFIPIPDRCDSQNERVVFESVNKGIYDIDFTIGILRKILAICDKHKTDPSYNLAMTLNHSLKDLLSFLEVQKCGVDRDPYVEMFCVNCGQKERVFKGDVDKWKKCKQCTPKVAFK